MKKRLLSYLLATAMTFALLPLSASAMGEPSLPPLGEAFTVTADRSDFTPAGPEAEPPAGAEDRPIEMLPQDYYGPRAMPNLFNLESGGPVLTDKNAVLPVRFHEEEEFVGKLGMSAPGSSGTTEYFTQPIFDCLELMYSTGEYSVADFFNTLTFGKISVESTIVSAGDSSDASPASYKTELPREYYEPLSQSNPLGYTEHIRVIAVYDEKGTFTGAFRVLPEIKCIIRSDLLSHHIPAKMQGTVVCPDCDAYFVRSGEPGGYTYELKYILKDESSASHEWEESVCILSGEKDLRTTALIGECMTFLESKLQSADYTSTTFWFSGDASAWNETLWPHQHHYQNMGKTDLDKLLYIMTNCLGITDASSPAFQLTASYLQQRYLDAGNGAPALGEAGKTLWEYIYNEDGIGYYANPGQPVYNLTFNDFGLRADTLVSYEKDGHEIKYPAISTACHEYGHVLGLPDYYCYANQSAPTVGPWSLMCNNLTVLPQYPNAYTVQHYWPGVLAQENVQEITESGVYTVDCFSSSGSQEGKTYLYTIDLPTGDAEHPEKLALEYRDNIGKYEGTKEWRNRLIPGLLLYQIDEASERTSFGNMAVPPEGPYSMAVCRVEGQGRLAFGADAYNRRPNYDPQIEADSKEFMDMSVSVLTDRIHTPSGGRDPVTLASSYGSADLSHTTNVIASQRTGKNTGITITDVTMLKNEQMSFRVTFPQPAPPPVTPSTPDTSAPKERYTISASSTEGGSISPSGEKTVSQGGRLSFTIKPEKEYRLVSLWVDGRSVPLQETYTFSDVSANHTIHAVFIKLLRLNEESPDVSFPDIASHWGRAAMEQMAELGLMTGVGGSFVPDAHMSRAMLLTALYRCAGRPETKAEGSAWYAEPLAWAASSGLSDGTAPEAPITREQAAVLLWRLSGSPSTEAQLYSDRASVSSWALAAMDWAVRDDILTGGDRGFMQPGVDTTRAEIAIILSRYLVRIPL